MIDLLLFNLKNKVKREYVERINNLGILQIFLMFTNLLFSIYRKMVSIILAKKNSSNDTVMRPIKKR